MANRRAERRAAIIASMPRTHVLHVGRNGSDKDWMQCLVTVSVNGHVISTETQWEYLPVS
jgi:hypothetical protein